VVEHPPPTAAVVVAVAAVVLSGVQRIAGEAFAVGVIVAVPAAVVVVAVPAAVVVVAVPVGFVMRHRVLVSLVSRAWMASARAI